MRIASQIFFILVLFLVSNLNADTSKSTPHLKVELLSESLTLSPGKTVWVGLHFQLEKNWHVYWINPGDSGQAPKIDWKLPSGLEAGPIEWPIPRPIPLGPLVNFGYEDSVLLMMPIKVPETRRVGEILTFSGRAKWLVCADVCIPGQADLTLDLPVTATLQVNPNTRLLFEQTRTRLPVKAPDEWRAHTAFENDALVMHLNASGLGRPRFFPMDSLIIANGAPQEVREKGKELELRLKKSDELKDVPAQLRGLLVFDSGAGFYVETQVTKPHLLAAMLAFAFLGGIILNLMPCVFPVLSIKVFSFLSQPKEEALHMRFHGLAYTAGILSSFWALVGVLLVLRQGGQQLGWGFQLQSPGFLVVLSLALFLFGLSLAGVFEMGSSLMGVGGGWAHKSGYAGSFFTGVLATVVATPCSAPFMGSAVGFALSQSALTAFLVFTSLGLGLAFPYVAISWHPRLANWLPRPGRWMETLKELMAFLVFGTVVWLIWVLGLQTNMSAVAGLLTALLLVGLASWILGRRRTQVGLVFGMTILVAAFAWGLRSVSFAQMNSINADSLLWEKFSPEAVDRETHSGKNVFVDFTAAWCLTCQANELVVFRSAEVREKLKKLGLVLMKADWTSYDPTITKTLASFGRSGVPLYVIYRPTGEPVVLPELINATLVLKELDKLSGP